MVIYTYLTKELFLLNLLVKLAELFDALVGLLTLGFVHPGTNYTLFMRLCVREYEVRCTKTKAKRTVDDVWPRKQIWPPLAKPKAKARAERDTKLASHGVDVKKLDENLSLRRKS